MVRLLFRTLFRIEMVITDLLSWFFFLLLFFIIYLTVKSFLTDFEFFFFSLTKILSLSLCRSPSLSPVLIQNESLIGVI